MKKILFFSMALCAISFAACGGNKTAEGDVADSTEVMETTAADVAANTVFEQLKAAAGDPAKLQAAVGVAQAKIQELLQAGDAEAVKQYTTILQNLINGEQSVKEALEAVKNTATTGTLMSAFNSVVDAATTSGATAESFVEATKAAGTDALTDAAAAVENAKAAVEAAPDAAKAAAEQAVNDARTKAEEAAKAKVDEAQQAAQKKAEEAQKKASDAANSAVEKGADAAKQGLKKLGL